MAKRWARIEKHTDDKGHRLGDWLRDSLTGTVVYCGVRENYNQGNSKSLLFRNTNSVCIDVETLKEIKSRGVKFIVFLVKTTNAKYATTVNEFEKFGVLHSFTHKDQRPQLALPIEKFAIKQSYTLKM
jgi:hypothetical protein